jgi:hypothetical protein
MPKGAMESDVGKGCGYISWRLGKVEYRYIDIHFDVFVTG